MTNFRCWNSKKPLAAVLLGSIGVFGCAHLTEQDKAEAEARASGMYKVHLTTEREKIMGTCKFVVAIRPQLDPVKIPPKSEWPDYYRVKAVVAGADTVVIDDRDPVGEAYICGPGPLNPDGTLQSLPRAVK